MTLLDELRAISAEEIASLAPREQEWMTALLERELTLQSPAAFATRLSRGQWLPYRHLVHTSDRIVAMVEGDETDCLLVEEPVRHGKTELCSRWTPAWFVAKHRKRALLTSYEADFAATHGRRAREIIAEFGELFGVKLDETSRAAHRWELIGGDGGMGTAGAGGPIIGKGGHLMIVDDPIKNYEEAHSPVMREHLWDWWQSVFLTRREPGAKVLVIMSRWHEDDLIARLLAADTGMRIERLRMPAVAEEDDPLGRTPGQALCSERFDEVALSGIRTDVGPTAWAAMYQQRPISVGGGMFRRDRFNYYTSRATSNGVFHSFGEKLIDDRECWRFSTMDPAFARSRRSDFTAIATWGVAPTDPPSLMLLDVRRVRVEHAEHAPLIREVWNTYSPAWVGLERQMATLSLFDEVQRAGVVVRWLKPDRNKIARAETAVAMVDAGRVWLPKGAEWLPEFLDEVVTFPVGKHDDQVDVLAYACAELAKRAVSPRKQRFEPTTLADRCWANLEQRNRNNHLHPVLGRIR